MSTNWKLDIIDKIFPIFRYAILKWVFILFHACFSPFFNCTNGNKSRKASHMFVCIYYKSPLFSCLLSPAFSPILMIFETTMTSAKKNENDTQTLYKKWSFPLRISSVNVNKSVISPLVTFTEEILNRKLHSLCSENFIHWLIFTWTIMAC